MSKKAIYKPEEGPVKCLNEDCGKNLEEMPTFPAKAYVVPGRILMWSNDECGWCSHRYRARTLQNGMIEVEYMGEPLDKQVMSRANLDASSILKSIRAAATGENQVASNDTECLQWIVKQIDFSEHTTSQRYTCCHQKAHKHFNTLTKTKKL